MIRGRRAWYRLGKAYRGESPADRGTLVEKTDAQRTREEWEAHKKRLGGGLLGLVTPDIKTYLLNMKD